MRPDPLSNPTFMEPGVLESLSEFFLGRRRPVDCVQVELSTVCQARCAYCPQGVAAGLAPRIMADETFAAQWPLFRTAARAHLQGWGEPFLHPRFFDFTALARKAGCLVSSTSCGLHMHEELARRIVDSGIDTLAFSLAGTDEATNAIRIGAPFASVCEKIRLLADIRARRMAVHLSLHCAYMLLADRMEAALTLPDLAAELGLHAVVVSTLDYVAAPEHHALAISPGETDKIALAREILETAAARAAALGLDFHYALPGGTPREKCREHGGLFVDVMGGRWSCVYAKAHAEVGAAESPCLRCPKRF